MRDPLHFPDETTLLSVAVAVVVRLSTVFCLSRRMMDATRAWDRQRRRSRSERGMAGRERGRSLPPSLHYSSLQLGELSPPRVSHRARDSQTEERTDDDDDDDDDDKSSNCDGACAFFGDGRSLRKE